MNEFIKDGDYIYINKPYVEVYIPMDLFDDPDKNSTISSIYGDGISTLGLFNMRFFDSVEDNIKRDSFDILTFNYPNTIETFPSEYEENVSLVICGIEDKYMILKYLKGDILMRSSTPRSSVNCEKFLNLIMKGKIPLTIDPINVFKTWIRNFEINNVNPGVPSVILQIIISEMYRNKNNPIEQFRKIAGKGNKKDYVAYNMNEVSSNTSILAALAFERFGDKLVSCLNMTKEGTKQIKSPIEKVLTM
jgi:hypothetical protein